MRNNIKGEEARLLTRYEEPSWNNPVVRFFAGDGKELLPRKDRVWSTADYATRLLAALDLGNGSAPAWLHLAVSEVAGERAKIVFAMPCFWEGEALLGAIEGVLLTHPAWVGGHEVVEVTYNPKTVELAALIQRADELKCSLRVFAPDSAALATARAVVGDRAQPLAEDGLRETKRSDSLYYLRRSSAHFGLSATPLQRQRMNSALRFRSGMEGLLSPRQLKQLEQLEAEATK